MRRTLLATLTAVLVAGCSAPGAPKSANQPKADCADTIATAFSSPDRSVNAAYTCFSPEAMYELGSLGLASADDIRRIAGSPPIMTSHMRLGATPDGGTAFLLRGPSATQLMLLYADARGLVYELHTTSIHQLT